MSILEMFFGIKSMNACSEKNNPLRNSDVPYTSKVYKYMGEKKPVRRWEVNPSHLSREQKILLQDALMGCHN